MNKILIVCITSLVILSCKHDNSRKNFIVEGEISNVADQNIYLEELYFSQKGPQVIDTVEISNGKFVLSAKATEEGLYRLRTDSLEQGFIFINDQGKIYFKADAKNIKPDGAVFNSPANIQLKKLITDLNTMSEAITALISNVDRLKASGNNDSLLRTETAELNEQGESFKHFILKFIDTVSNPVVAMFALGYTQNIDASELKVVVPNLSKRFPKHQGVATMVMQYNEFVTQQNQQKQVNTRTLQIGSTAPDFTMNDVNDKPFSLKSMKGKYVLVDFWASWCGPCRDENQYVVESYHKFRNKNFTILGVSLDEDKDKWLNAIKDDKLSWKQVSDLKGMGSLAVTLYGFEAIPFNVLIDPEGKIIASSLRGKSLEEKLNEVFK